MKQVVIGVFGAILLGLCVSLGYALRDMNPNPISAVGFIACGKAVGAVVILSDGTQRRYTPQTFPEAVPDITRLPQGAKGVLMWTGVECSGRPRVY